jgi:hypothetical protein
MEQNLQEKEMFIRPQQAAYRKAVGDEGTLALHLAATLLDDDEEVLLELDLQLLDVDVNVDVLAATPPLVVVVRHGLSDLAIVVLVDVI